MKTADMLDIIDEEVDKGTSTDDIMNKIKAMLRKEERENKKKPHKNTYKLVLYGTSGLEDSMFNLDYKQYSMIKELLTTFLKDWEKE